MDIPRAVEQIYKDAQFAYAATYADLQRTWQDARQIPTEQELAVAWLEVLEEDARQEADNIINDVRFEILLDEDERNKLTTDERLELLIENYIRDNPRTPTKE